MAKKKLLSCADCGECCTYIAIEIDTPTSKTAFADLFWHLLHRDVSIYIDHERKWHLEFQTLCRGLDENKRCSIYDDRPLVCRKYSIDSCTRHTRGEYYLHKFTTPEELKKYLDKKGIDYTFKRLPK